MSEEVKEILPRIIDELKNLDQIDKFSYRKVKNKTKKVYEANITVFDALKKSDTDSKGEFLLER